MAAIEEVVDWAVTTTENQAHHPVGPQGRDAARTSKSFQELQAAIARWRDSLGGGSPLTTKGDIYTFSTIEARLPVGTNGQILSANAGEATGLEWIDATGIGGSIADNQIAVGSATADEIEGSTALLFDGTVLEVAATAPALELNETDAALDQKKWRASASGEQLILSVWDDAEANSWDFLTVDRSGTGAGVVADNVQLRVDFLPMFTDAYDLGSTSLRWQALYLENSIDLSGASPDLAFNQDTAGLDQKFWWLEAAAESLYWEIYSDSFANSYRFFEVQRSGTGAGVQVDTLDFTAVTDITLNTAIANLGTMSFDADQTIGVGQDNYILTYDDGTGLISLEPAPAVAAAGANNEIQFNNSGVLGADPFLSVDLTGTGGQAPKLILDGTSGTYRYPTIEMNYDADDYAAFDIYEEGVVKAYIRYYASFGGIDQLLFENMALGTSDTTGIISFATRTSGGSRQTRFQINRNGPQILQGGLEIGDAPSAPHTDRASYGQIFLRSSDNLLIFRNSAGTEYDLTGTVPQSSTVVSGTSPYFGWIETDATLDQGYWRATADAEALTFSIWDDAETNTKNWLQVQRSGTGVNVLVDSVQILAGVTEGMTFNSTGLNIDANTLKLGTTLANQITFNNTSGLGDLSITIENGGNIEILDGNTANTQRFLFDVDLGSLQMDGNLDLAYIDGYAGTPGDGEVLTWVSANGRAEFSAAAGGGIGGSIADNQVAVGAATANEIEGSASLTYNGSTLAITGALTTSTGTSTFGGAIVSGGNITLPATSRLYLDGASNTYISESADDVINFTAGTTSVFNIRSTEAYFIKGITEAAVNLTGTAIDLHAGTYFYKTISGATTLTFTNPATSGEVSSFTLELINAGSNVTWPTSVDWPGGTAPTLTTTGTDILVFVTRDGGTTWHGMLSSLDSK